MLDLNCVIEGQGIIGALSNPDPLSLLTATYHPPWGLRLRSSRRRFSDVNANIRFSTLLSHYCRTLSSL